MTTGSHNQQIYWYATGNSRVLGQLPAIWLTADRRWIPRRAAVMHPPGQRPSRRPAAGTPCASRVTRPTADPGSTRRSGRSRSRRRPPTRRPPSSASRAKRATDRASSTRGQPQPAAPVRDALERRRRPHHRPADAIDPRLSSQVCGQCHSFWEFADAQGERQANVRGLPYRPGDELATTRFIVQPTRNLDTPAMKAFLAGDAGFIRDIFWSDGMVRVTGREYNGLVDSPCYKNATDEKRTLSCFSCHTMHVTGREPRPIGEWADDQLAPGASGDEACLQCHATGSRRTLAAHTHTPRRLRRQRLLQLPHAVHDVRPAEDDPQPSNQQPVSAGDARDRPAERLQPVPPRQNAGVDRRDLERWYGSAAARLETTSSRSRHRCCGC